MLDSTPEATIESQAPRILSPVLLSSVALATGALVANLYYAQPLIAEIGPAIGLSPDLSGAIVAITQIGYGLGLFFLVSLADRIENKKLVLVMIGLTTLALVTAAISTGAAAFLIASLIIGLCSTAAQVLVAFVSQLVAPEQRGQVVGNVMSALLAGIMLARPLALFVAAAAGWRAIFWGSAVLTLGIGFALAKTMPRHAPGGGLTYGRIIASMAGLLMSISPLRWRAAYQALLFGAFSLFWTIVPLVLVDRFGMGESGIGLFALAGAGGALAAPIAGRLADRGFGQAATAAAMVTAAVSFFATSWAVGTGALVLLAVLAVLIDAAVQTNHIVSQRIIFSTPAATRGRVNALYMTFTFIGGAIGSMLGTLIYHANGWSMTAAAGGLTAVVALVLFGLERAGSAKR